MLEGIPNEYKGLETPSERFSYIINSIIKECGYESYLELGTGHCELFSRIKCHNKTGVDNDKNNTPRHRLDKRRGVGWPSADAGIFNVAPNGDFNSSFIRSVYMCAEDFIKYAEEKEHKDYRYDIIHRDCGYTHDTVKDSLIDSLRVLNQKGTVICHFSDPHHKWHQEYEGREDRSEDEAYLSDGWKALVELQYDDQYQVDIAIIKNDSGYPDPKIADGFDHGLAVIRKISHKNTKKRSFSDYFLDYDYYEKNKHVIMNIISLSDFFKKYTTYNNHANNSNKFWSK